MQVVRRRAWLIALAAIVTPLAAIALSLNQPDLYQASAEVLLNRQNLANSLTGTPDTTIYQQPERNADTQADLARVPILAERILAQLELRDRTPQAFLGQSSVSAKTNRDLLVFRVTDADPPLAMRLATEYARQFTLYRRELDTTPIIRARAGVSQRVNQLERAGNTQSALYVSLVEKEQQLRTMEALLTSPATLVHPADASVRVQPKPVRNAVLGLALGIVLGLGLAFLWEALDTRMRDADSLAQRLGLPLLARLPAPPRHLASMGRIVMLEEPNEPEAEPFRVLRTNVEFANLERGARTIVVTSALPGEGKSTTAANLAVALARAGRHIVLVDLDLRRPTIDSLFGLERRPGLTHVALGRVDLASATTSISLTPYGNNGEGGQQRNGRVPGMLEVLAAGLIPPQPGEFVNSRVIDDILGELAARAHLVIIDAPPLLGVGDALSLSAKVDAMLVVCRLNAIRRQTIDELRRVLDNCPADKLGFVVSGAETDGGHYGDGYYYVERADHYTSDALAQELDEVSGRGQGRGASW